MGSLLYTLPLLAGFLTCIQGMINGFWQAKIGLYEAFALQAWRRSIAK